MEINLHPHNIQLHKFVFLECDFFFKINLVDRLQGLIVLIFHNILLIFQKIFNFITEYFSCSTKHVIHQGHLLLQVNRLSHSILGLDEAEIQSVAIDDEATTRNEEQGRTEQTKKIENRTEAKCINKVI